MVEAAVLLKLAQNLRSISGLRQDSEMVQQKGIAFLDIGAQ